VDGSRPEIDKNKLDFLSKKKAPFCEGGWWAARP
jgi:hypothetical protein